MKTTNTIKIKTITDTEHLNPELAKRIKDAAKEVEKTWNAESVRDCISIHRGRLKGETLDGDIISCKVYVAPDSNEQQLLYCASMIIDGNFSFLKVRAYMDRDGNVESWNPDGIPNVFVHKYEQIF